MNFTKHCSDLSLFKWIVLVIEKNLCNSRLKAEYLKKNSHSRYVRTISVTKYHCYLAWLVLIGPHSHENIGKICNRTITWTDVADAKTFTLLFCVLYINECFAICSGGWIVLYNEPFSMEMSWCVFVIWKKCLLQRKYIF